MVITVSEKQVVKVQFSFEEWSLIRTAITKHDMLEDVVIEEIIQCGFDKYFLLPENKYG